jgi:hypothetical protein
MIIAFDKKKNFFRSAQVQPENVERGGGILVQFIET